MDKSKKAKKPADLKGFRIEVNEFGQIVRNRSVEEVNAFLNENVEDLKLAEHPDFEQKKKEEG